MIAYLTTHGPNTYTWQELMFRCSQYVKRCMDTIHKKINTYPFLEYKKKNHNSITQQTIPTQRTQFFF